MTAGTDAFSWPQCRALVRVHLAEALRPGRNAEGIAIRPLRQILVPMALLGVWLAVGSRAEGDLFRLRSLFLSSAVLVALAVLPDPAEAFARRRDVLGHLPVGRATGSAARLLFLLAIQALLLAPYAAPTLLHVAWRGTLGPARLLALAAALLALASTGVGLWLSLAFLVAGRFGVDAVRRVASYTLSLVLLGVALLGSFSLVSGRPRSLGAVAPLVEALPSSWFANALLPGGSARAPLEAAAAVALLVLGTALLLRLRPESVYEQGRALRRERDGVAVRLARTLQGEAATGDGTRALALFVLRVASREPMGKLRSRSLLLSLLGVALFATFYGEAFVTLPAIAAFGLMTVASGALDLAMSSDAEAAWSIGAAPLPARARVAALRSAALLRSAPLPTLLVLALAGWSGPWLDAPLFGLAFAGVAFWLVSATLLLRPREPLATPASVAGGNAMVWLGLPLAFAGMMALSPAWWFVDLPAPIAPVATLVYAGSLAAFGQGFLALAARRLEAAEARR